MVRQNMTATRIKPAVEKLLTMHVQRRERISPNFVRVTLGGGDIGEFVPMGFDQWFRLFIPVSENSLPRLPNRLDTLSYLRFLTIARTERPVLRNYTVRAYRETGPAGPELDVDFVLHGSAADGTAGQAATWAHACQPGDAVALLDEGIAFNPSADRAGHAVLVADETGLPAAAGILASLPRDASGIALIEIADPDDAQDLDTPGGVEVSWIPRTDAAAVPGAAALTAGLAAALPDRPLYCWTAGEQSLVSGMRRHWVRSGVPKDAISFCGYWKHAAHR